jgi:hypothetical protein
MPNRRNPARLSIEAEVAMFALVKANVAPRCAPTPFQDQRSIGTPASKRLARRRAPQPERPTYYLRTSRGDDAMWGVSPVRGARDHGGSKPQGQRRALS